MGIRDNHNHKSKAPIFLPIHKALTSDDLRREPWEYMGDCILNQNGKDRRRKIRVSFDTQVVIRSKGSDVTARANSKDISINGLFAQTDADLPLGTACDIDILLGGTTEDLTIRVKGKVVRKDDNGVGIAFESVELDSYIHLKNLLRYNAEDPDAIDSEIFV